MICQKLFQYISNPKNISQVKLEPAKKKYIYINQALLEASKAKELSFGFKLLLSIQSATSNPIIECQQNKLVM